MNVFPFLHFFNLMVYTYLAVYIFTRSNALLNRIFTAILSAFALWSFVLIFIHSHHISKDTAMVLEYISAPSWIGFCSLFFWFTAVFTGQESLLKKKWFYLLLVGLPLLFIYKQWTGFLIVDFSREYYGLKPLFSRTIWPHLFYAYYISFMAAALYFNFDFKRKTSNPVLKKQAGILFVTVSITLVLGTLTDMIFPLLDIHIIPNVADTLALIWTVGVAFAIAKYKFLKITPATAAGNIISTMFDGLILLNLEGEIVFVNNAVSNMSGYKEDELRGAPVDTLFMWNTSKDGAEVDIPGERNLKNRDFILRTKNGDRVPVLFSSSVLRDETGEAGGIVCVAKDISERKRLEEELFKSKKLESIGLLAGGIAHDFNNLLSVIMGNILLARETIPGESDAYHQLVKAEEASIKAAELAGKFITFSPGGWVNAGKVILTNLIKNIESGGLPGADTDIAYHIDIPDTVAPICGDPGQLYQVIKSLFLNAAEAMPPMSAENEKTGIINLRAENITLEDSDEESILLKKGNYIKITIEDNGKGIPPDNIEKIFDPYFSTKETYNRKGTGLGLTTGYSIIKKHEGHIAVESEVGKGTVVTLYLPAFKKKETG